MYVIQKLETGLPRSMCQMTNFCLVD